MHCFYVNFCIQNFTNYYFQPRGCSSFSTSVLLPNHFNVLFKQQLRNKTVACSSIGKKGKNQVVEKGGTNLAHTNPVRDKSEEDEEDRSFWAQYYCTTCQWLLGGAEGLLQHNRYLDAIKVLELCIMQQFLREQRGRHHNVKPLWSFNQQEVQVQDLKKSRK